MLQPPSRTQKQCSLENCSRLHKARSLCSEHYALAKGRGEFGPKQCMFEGCLNVDFPSTTARKCVDHYSRCFIDGCLRQPSNGKGAMYCMMHYLRLFNDGSAGGCEPRNLGTIKPGEVRPWSPDGKGYVTVVYVENGKRIKTKQHRYVVEQHLGRKLLPDENIHHLNGDRADNRLENLELWNTGQPSGQRIADKITWANEIIERYGSDASEW